MNLDALKALSGGCTPQRHPDQPPDDIEFALADGVFIKGMFLAKAGMIVPQHAHEYDHASLVAAGAVAVYADDDPHGVTYTSPSIVNIPAGMKHAFVSLEDNTRVYCVHNVSRAGHVEVREEHHLEGVS